MADPQTDQEEAGEILRLMAYLLQRVTDVGPRVAPATVAQTAQLLGQATAAWSDGLIQAATQEARHG